MWDFFFSYLRRFEIGLWEHLAKKHDCSYLKKASLTKVMWTVKLLLNTETISWPIEKKFTVLLLYTTVINFYVGKVDILPLKFREKPEIVKDSLSGFTVVPQKGKTKI